MVLNPRKKKEENATTTEAVLEESVLKENSCYELGHVQHHYVCIPDVEELLREEQ